MLPGPFRTLSLPMIALLLASFRMPATDEVADKLLYDVRGAFVTAQSNVPPDLITQTDTLVDAAIQATDRSILLPRTILTVQIKQTSQTRMLFGSRYSATVAVKAISVGSGEPVAEGSFEASAFHVGKGESWVPLARNIAARIAAEFQLKPGSKGAVVTALVQEPRS